MMTRHEIAEALEELALLLVLQGENPFKIRAYENAARALEGLQDDLATLIAEDRLLGLPGFGKAIAEKVAILHRTGSLPLLEELRAKTPPGLLEMLEIPNFGPKRLQKVHAELGITTLAELEAAAQDGRLAKLPGFGAKSAQKILDGIRNRQAYRQRHLWWEARPIVREILQGLRALPQVQQAEAAGSYRRGRETVGDLDFLVASTAPGPVMDWFTAQPLVKEVTARGDTKSSVRFASGLQADLRVVPPEQFVFALHHFTGSKEHNVAMRSRALDRGYSMSEWGLFPAEAKHGPSADGAAARSVVQVANEEELFRFLDLHYIPPELREDRGEIQAAERAPLPRLVQVNDLRGVFHNHTVASDGRATLAEMAAAAEAQGWEYFGIADHSRSSWQANGLDEERLAAQVDAIQALNDSGRFRVHLFTGCEVDILRDGSLDFPRAVLDRLDYVVLSVHAAMTGLSEDEMTTRIIRALETPLSVKKILGHLTGRLLLRREGYEVNHRRVIDAAAANGVVIELNANPWRLDMDWRHWPYAREKGVLCAVNPDAHRVEDLGYVEAGVASARKGGLTPAEVLNTRSLADIRQFLGR